MPWLLNVDAVCMGERLPGMTSGHVLIRRPDGSDPSIQDFTTTYNYCSYEGEEGGGGGVGGGS